MAKNSDQTNDPAAQQHKPKRTRSPNYPAISLDVAIERARALHKAEGKHPAPYTVVAGHWDYKPDSSSAMQAVAALKAFGLVVIKGQGDDREVGLSERALDILLDETEDSTQRKTALKQAALDPAIHRELWTKYGGTLPSDAALRTFLQRERGFNPKALGPFIDQFKKTISVAQLDSSDIVEPETPRNDGPDLMDAMGFGKPLRSPPPAPPPPPGKPPMPPAGSKQDTFTLDEGQVVLQWPNGLSASSFEDFKDWLELQLRKIGRSIQDKRADPPSHSE